MLQKLYVKNYALIDELELVLTDHLNIITGETGAGKSLLVDALALARWRADPHADSLGG